MPLPDLDKPHRLPPGAQALECRRFAHRLLTQGEAREDVAHALRDAMAMPHDGARRLVAELARRYGFR